MIGDPNELLINWLRGVKKAQIAYTRSAVHLEKLHYWLGGTVIVLSTLASTSLFATSFYVKVASSIASVIAAILASFQTFYRLSERAEKFRAIGAKYGQLRRDIEHKLAFLPESQEKLENYAELLLEKQNRIKEEAPPTPQWIWEEVKKEPKEKYKV